MIEATLIENNELPSLLIVDDDSVFCGVLSKAMTKRGFSVVCAHTIDDAVELAETSAPEFVP